MSFKLTVGRVAIAGTGLFTNEAIAAFHVDQSKADPVWLYHALPRIARSGVVDQAVKGQTLNKKKLQSLSTLLPPLPEQRRIAEILDTVDEAIRKTEEVIAKLKQVKAGLLHDLLTRGIDEHGQLRDPIAHPEQFKDSPLGWIPREWSAMTLGEAVLPHGGLIQTGPFGSQLHAHEYVDEGVPVIMPQDIDADRITVDQIAYIPPEKAMALARHRVTINDVVFARRGDLSRAVAIGERESGWLCGTGCLLVRGSRERVNAGWLALTYRHIRSQRQILARAVGSTMVNLNSTLLTHLLIALPPKHEQDVIAEISRRHEERTQTERASLEKLRLVKLGLMSDLLSGRGPAMDGKAEHVERLDTVIALE